MPWWSRAIPTPAAPTRTTTPGPEADPPQTDFPESSGAPTDRRPDGLVAGPLVDTSVPDPESARRRRAKRWYRPRRSRHEHQHQDLPGRRLAGPGLGFPPHARPVDRRRADRRRRGDQCDCRRRVDQGGRRFHCVLGCRLRSRRYEHFGRRQDHGERRYRDHSGERHVLRRDCDRRKWAPGSANRRREPTFGGTASRPQERRMGEASPTPGSLDRCIPAPVSRVAVGPGSDPSSNERDQS